MTTFPSTMTPRRRAVPDDARPAPADPGPLFAEPVPDAPPAAYDPLADVRPVALVTLYYHGVPVQLDIQAVTSDTLAGVEKRIDRLLTREGWTAPPVPAAAAPARPPKPAELRQEPLYQPDGTPCCPIHKKPLKQGQHGYYCSAKAEPPYGSDRGYCRYSWKDGE